VTYDSQAKERVRSEDARCSHAQKQGAASKNRKADTQTPATQASKTSCVVKTVNQIDRSTNHKAQKGPTNEDHRAAATKPNLRHSPSPVVNHKNQKPKYAHRTSFNVRNPAQHRSSRHRSHGRLSDDQERTR